METETGKEARLWNWNQFGESLEGRKKARAAIPAGARWRCDSRRNRLGCPRSWDDKKKKAAERPSDEEFAPLTAAKRQLS